MTPAVTSRARLHRFAGKRHSPAHSEVYNDHVTKISYINVCSNTNTFLVSAFRNLSKTTSQSADAGIRCFNINRCNDVSWMFGQNRNKFLYSYHDNVPPQSNQERLALLVMCRNSLTAVKMEWWKDKTVELIKYIQGRNVRASNTSTACPIYSISTCPIYSMFKNFIF